MNALGFRLRITLSCIALAIPVVATGQTFEINQSGQVNSGTSQQSHQQNPITRGNSPKPATSWGGMGWGNSIEVARQARAAQEALNKGEYGTAVTFAERAAKAAPQNTDFWFMLGYASRLAGQYQKSLDAYQQGLQRQPNSVQGLSGMAQTYARMGRTDDAKKALMKVLAANPKSPNDLNLAGELFLTTNDS